MISHPFSATAGISTVDICKIVEDFGFGDWRKVKSLLVLCKQALASGFVQYYSISTFVAFCRRWPCWSMLGMTIICICLQCSSTSRPNRVSTGLPRFIDGRRIAGTFDHHSSVVVNLSHACCTKTIAQWVVAEVEKVGSVPVQRLRHGKKRKKNRKKKEVNKDRRQVDEVGAETVECKTWNDGLCVG